MDQSLNIKQQLATDYHFGKKLQQSRLFSWLWQNIVDPVTMGISHTFFSDNKTLAYALAAALIIFSPLNAVAGFTCIAYSVFLARKLRLERAGVVPASIAVNGLFLGLALGTFATGYPVLFCLLLVAPILLVFAAIIAKRLLLPWNLPVVVLPYMLTIWFLWYLSAGSLSPWLAVPLAQGSHGSILADILAAYFRGFSQIFFVEQEALGMMIFLILLAHFKRVGVEIGIAAVYALAVPYVLGVEGWIAQSGLTIFSPVFVIVACESSFDKLKKSAKYALAGLAPAVELITLRMGLSVGLPAISLSYVLLVWGGILVLSYRSQMEKTMWGGTGLKLH